MGFDCVDFSLGLLIITNFAFGIFVFVLGLLTIDEFHINPITIFITLAGIFIILLALLLLVGRYIKSSKLVLIYISINIICSIFVVVALLIWMVVSPGFLALFIVSIVLILTQDSFLYLIYPLYKRFKLEEFNKKMKACEEFIED